MNNKCKLIIKDEVNIKLEGLDVDIRRKISNSLKFPLPYARFLPKFKLKRWDGKIPFFSIGGTGYLNHLDTIIQILEKNRIKITEIQDLREKIELKFSKIDQDFWGERTWPEGHPLQGQLIKLREHQVNAVNIYLENPQSLQEISTAAGKTMITATLSKIAEKYGKSLVIVPNKSLVLQTEIDYINCGLDTGVYYGDRKDLSKTHTICTWQSLNALDKKEMQESEYSELTEFLENVSCVIVDECHTVKGEVLKKMLTERISNAPIRWGLTGTIPKEDFEFQALKSSIGPVVGKISAKELQEKGILSNCHINIIQIMDTMEFKDYQSELKYLVSNEKRLSYVADTVKDIRQTGNTLILVDRIAAGEILKEMIPDSSFVKGDVKAKDRKDTFDEINQSDDMVVIATYGVASTGINIVNLYNVVLIEPGKSFIRVIQSIGRGLRKSDKKDFVNIWDITSTCKFSKRHLTERKKFYKEREYPFSIKKVDIWSNE